MLEGLTIKIHDIKYLVIFENEKRAMPDFCQTDMTTHLNQNNILDPVFPKNVCPGLGSNTFLYNTRLQFTDIDTYRMDLRLPSIHTLSYINDLLSELILYNPSRTYHSEMFRNDSQERRKSGDGGK